MKAFVPRDLPEASLVCVPPAEIPHWIEIVMPMIDRAYSEFGLDLPEWMLGDLERGHALLWLAVSQEHEILAVLVTRLVPTRRGLECRMSACSGHQMALWSAFHLEIERYAKGEGCVKVTVEGRPGWARALSGYQVARVVLEKDLS